MKKVEVDFKSLKYLLRKMNVDVHAKCQLREGTQDYLVTVNQALIRLQ